MTRGKRLCELLKSIRVKIAKSNNIEYEPHECHNEKNCSGTCPVCDAELEYLTKEIERLLYYNEKALIDILSPEEFECCMKILKDEDKVVLDGIPVQPEFEILTGITAEYPEETEYVEPPRITPEKVTKLNENEIFVFGSNINGIHGGGAARFAYLHFGAKWGVGEGLAGQSYALPTMEGEASFKAAVIRFIQFARRHHELTFLVTPVGCGIAGYDPKVVAPWFAETRKMRNVYLPQCFLPAEES